MSTNGNMANGEDRLVVLFRSISDLMESDLLCLTHGFAHQIEPIPSQVSSDCGMCIAISRNDAEALSQALHSRGIPFSIAPRTEKRGGQKNE